MISLIVPTYNRAYALIQVLDTFYRQEGIGEIIFIDDCSCDDTKKVIQQFSNKYPHIHTSYLYNDKKRGASYSRMRGVENAKMDYILFCDDDEFLGKNYAKVCLEKLLSGAGEIISGRHLYRNLGESPEEAIVRFGNGLYFGNVFGKIRFKVYTDVIFDKDLVLPFTHGIFLTSKKLLNRFKIDPFYAKGNGYREESDFQMNAYLHGIKILMINDVHCVHMNMKEVRSGGQRVGRLSRFFWNIYYTTYFLRKFYKEIRRSLDLHYPFSIAILLYVIAEFYDFFMRPIFYLVKKLFKVFK